MVDLSMFKSHMATRRLRCNSRITNITVNYTHYASRCRGGKYFLQQSCGVIIFPSCSYKIEWNKSMFNNMLGEEGDRLQDCTKASLQPCPFQINKVRLCQQYEHYGSDTTVLFIKYVVAQQRALK